MTTTGEGGDYHAILVTCTGMVAICLAAWAGENEKGAQLVVNVQNESLPPLCLSEFSFSFLRFFPLFLYYFPHACSI